MADTSDVVPSTLSSPQDAASNIQNATAFSMTPVADKSVNDNLKETLTQKMIPTDVTQPVKDYMGTSTEHAALAIGADPAKPGDTDLPVHDFIANTAQWFSDIYNNRPTPERQMTDLYNKKADNNGQLSDEDLGKLYQLQSDTQKQSASLTPHAPPSYPMQMLQGVGGALDGMVRSLRKNAPLIGEFTGVGAATGFLGGPFAEVTVPAGAATGLTLGVTSALAIDAYDSTRGSIYGLLDNMKNDDGTPMNIDETTKKNTAYGAGLVSSALMTVTGGAIGKAIPFLNPNVSPAIAKLALTSPAMAATRLTLQRIGHTMITMAGVGELSAATNILATEFAKNYDGTPESINDALYKASHSLENWGKVADAGVVGGLTGGVIAGVAGAVGAKSTLKSVGGAEAAPPSNPDIPLLPGGPKDVTPAKPAATYLDALNQQAADIRTALNKSETAVARGKPSEMLGPQAEHNYRKELQQVEDKITASASEGKPPEDSVQQSVKALQMEDALNDITEAAKQTKMHKLAPGEMIAMIKSGLDKAGITKMYTTIQGMRDYVTGHDSSQSALNLMDSSGKMAAGIEAPFEVDPSKVIDIGMDDPKIFGHMKMSPDEPSPLQGRAHLETVKTKLKEKNDIISRLGLKFADDGEPVEPPTNVIPIGSKAKSEMPFDMEGHVRRADEILKTLATPDLEDKQKSKLNDELEKIKTAVAAHLQTQKPGDLLIPQFGHWPTPGIDDVNKAASDHINEPTFSDAMEKILPKEEVQKFNIAIQNARKDKVDSIKEAAYYEMEKVQDQMVELAKEARIEQERLRIENDPNFAIVDKVRNAAKIAKINKEKFSIYQIDPATLPNHLFKIVDSPRLKEYKIFAKGANDADGVAHLLGLKDAEEFLKILAKTPPREQVIKARADANRIADEREARDSVDLNHTRAMEAIDDEIGEAHAELKFMKDHEWPTLKGAIKRISLSIKPTEEVKLRARTMVMQTKVGSLNANVYRVAEKQNHRKGINAIFKIKPYEAWTAFENRIVALAALKETQVRTGEINRGLRFMRKLNTKTNRAILREAGPLSVKAMKELTMAVNFKPKTQHLPSGIEDGPTGDYLKWAEKEVKAGRGDFSMPEALMELKASYKDLTVEQFLMFVDRARVVFNEAKLHNQLIRDELDDAKAEQNWQVDRIAEKIVEHCAGAPGIPSKLPPVQDTVEPWHEKVFNFFRTSEELIAAKQNVVREMDRGETGGLIFRTLDEPMEGSGKSFEKEGYTYQKKWNAWLDSELTRINKAHGDPFGLEAKFLDIPEFHDIVELNNGILTKGDLCALGANLGQEYTRAMIEKNNKVSFETCLTVLDRELETKDVQYVQAIIDLYKNKALREKTKELQRKQGRIVEFIEGLPWVHRGITYPGGYIRVRTVHKYTIADVKKAKDILEGKGAAYYEKDEAAKWAEQYAAETTRQGYLVSRVGNSEPIALRLYGIVDGLREIIHDHAYREPLQNFFTIMDHPDVIPALIKAVGEHKVNTLISTNLEIAGRPSQKDAGFFQNPNRATKNVLNKFGSNFALSVIWANMSATIKQIEAFPEMFAALGPKSMVHFAHVNWTMLTHLDRVHELIKAACRLDPNLAKYIDGVNDDTEQVIDELVPKKGQKFRRSLPGAAYEFAKSAGFFPHQAADIYAKLIQVFTVQKHVLAGDHPNYPREKLNQMSNQEQFEAVQTVIQQMSSLTQIQNRHELKALIQKSLEMKEWTFFWNYPRNIINNNILDARRASWKLRQANAKLGSGGGGFGKPPSGGGGGGGGSGGGGGGGDFGGAMKDLGGAANIIAARLCWNVVSAMITAIAAGGTAFAGFELFELLKKNIDWKDPKAVKEHGEAILGEMCKINAEHVVKMVPVVNAMQFADSSKKKYKMAEVKNPVTQGLSSLTTCLPALKDMITLSRYPDRMQMRACMESESYAFMPWPVRGWLKGMSFLDEHSLSSAGVDIPSNFKANFNTAQVDSTVKELKDFVKDPGDANKELVAKADALHKQLAPSAVQVPTQAADTIKMAESGGQNKQNGLYGFTSSDWKGIMRSAPELGLTENGRTAKDTTQQEKAIDWSLHQNAGLLAEKDLPVNSETLYGVHKLGFDDYVKVLNATADSKVKTVLGADAFKDHPELQAFKTIGQVKSYLSSKVESGRKALESDKNLTSKQSKNED